MEALDVKEFTSRTTAEEIATIEICPAYPEFMVVGTYHLIKNFDQTDNPTQVRKGTLLIMPVDSTFRPEYPGQLPPNLDCKTFLCSIFDVHFHPSDPTLLGVATSSAQIYFFRLTKHAEVVGGQVVVKLIELGSATVSEHDEENSVPGITQFTWLPGTAFSGEKDLADRQSVTLIATTSHTEVILVTVALPAEKSVSDQRITHAVSPPAVSTTIFPSHTLEAWCVATSSVRILGGLETFIVLSGGDDSAMIASSIELNRLGFPGNLVSGEPIHLFTDKKTHEAGVVAILPLKPIKVPDGEGRVEKFIVPILTGSYDENIRLFIYDASLSRKTFIDSAKLGGGVWRLKQIDSYVETLASTTNTSQEKFHVLVLASCMHAGAHILRISHTAPLSSSDHDAALSARTGWTIETVAKFTAGHDVHIVYCCDFRAEKGRVGEYTVVSTSFYNMQICGWRWGGRGQEQACCRRQ